MFKSKAVGQRWSER